MQGIHRFQLKLRNNLVLFNYSKPLHLYSFLQSNIFKIKKLYKNTQDSLTKNPSNPHVDRFSFLLLKHQNQIQKLLQHDFKDIDLKNIDLRGLEEKTNGNHQMHQISQSKAYSTIGKSFTNNYSVLQDLALTYSQMQQSLTQNLSQSNLTESILTLFNYNCIDIQIWQKVISYIVVYYKSSPLRDRVIYTTAISEYIKKFEHAPMASKKFAFKFMYPESLILDLIQFRALIKGLENQQDFVKQSDTDQEEQLKLRIFQNITYLIMKITKKSDMNVYSVKKYFQKRQKQMVLIASRYQKSQPHKDQLYHIYFIYSYLNIDSPTFLQEIQKYYYQMFKQMMNNKSNHENLCYEVDNVKSKQMNKLLSIWKLNSRANLPLYHSTIKPLLKQMILHNQQTSYFSNFIFNIVTAGIDDFDTVIELIRKFDENQQKEDECIHMLKHYVNAIKKQPLFESRFHSCKSIQHPTIVKYLQDKNVPLLSCCLNTEHKLHKLKRSFEFRRVEKFWGDSVKKIFQNRYEIMENAPFCNYEIDYLVLTKQFILAVEVQGGHYNKKQQNRSVANETSSEKLQQTGKKDIRDVILKAYGIKSVKIHCEEKIPTYVMQGRDVELGAKYLAKKIEEQLGVKIHDL